MEQDLQTDSILGSPKLSGILRKLPRSPCFLHSFLCFCLCYNFCILQINGGKGKQPKHKRKEGKT